MKKNKRVVVIGGGTGSFVVLFGLKQYPLNLSAIITMMDSGGSTGKLRDQYGVLPPGDVRQALVALSESEKIWRELFLYRFTNGDLVGHNFGNLFLTVLEKITGSFEKAITLAEEILKTKGEVIPITLKKTHLNALLADGRTIKTEGLIDAQEKRAPIKKLFLNKSVSVNQKALQTINQADIIIVGPGDLYTSILPNFMFKEFVQAYQKSQAQKIFVLNLMNKLGHTDNYQAADYLEKYQEYLGKQPFDYVVINQTPLPKKMLATYEQYGESQVTNNLKPSAKPKILMGDLLNQSLYIKAKGDRLTRSLVRHEPDKLARFLWQQIINNAAK